MRKLLTLLLALSYSVLSTGAVSLLHYCQHDGALHLEHFWNSPAQAQDHCATSAHSHPSHGKIPVDTSPQKHACCSAPTVDEAPHCSEVPTAAHFDTSCCVSAFTALPSFPFENTTVSSLLLPTTSAPAVSHPTAEVVRSEPYVSQEHNAPPSPLYRLFSRLLFYA